MLSETPDRHIVVNEHAKGREIGLPGFRKLHRTAAPQRLPADLKPAWKRTGRVMPCLG